MLIPRCCKNCSNRGGICHCVSPLYSDLIEDTHPETPIIYNPILIEETPQDIRIKQLEKEITKLKEQIKELNKGLRRKTKGE